MARKRRLGNYAIHRADALEWLKTQRAKSVRAVVTDPPYGVVEYLPSELRKRENGKGIWRLPQAYDGYNRISTPRFTVLSPADHKRIKEFHAKLAPLLLRVLVPGGHVMMASHSLLTHLAVDAFVEAGFEFRGQVARVVKTLRGGDRPKGAHDQYPDVSVTPRSCWEPWLIFRRPCEGLVRENLKKWGTGALRRPERDVPFMDLISAGPARGQEREIAPHPSVKPQALMRVLVAAALPLGRGTVLDPFMGAGSTLAAASALGVRSIGVELNAKYFNLARRAIPQLAKLQLNGAANGHHVSVQQRRSSARSNTQRQTTHSQTNGRLVISGASRIGDVSGRRAGRKERPT